MTVEEFNKLYYQGHVFRCELCDRQIPDLQTDAAIEVWMDQQEITFMGDPYRKYIPTSEKMIRIQCIPCNRGLGLDYKIKGF